MDVLEDSSAEDVDVNELAQEELLENYIQSYTWKVLHAETPRQEKIQTYHRIAVILEQEESKFQGGCEDPFEVSREGSPVEDLLHILFSNDSLSYQLMHLMLHETDLTLLTAVARLILIVCTIHENILPVLSMDREEEHATLAVLVKLMMKEEPSPLRTFATGIIAAFMRGRPNSHSEILAGDIPKILFDRLAQYVNCPPPSKQTLALTVCSIDPATDNIKPELSSLHITEATWKALDRRCIIMCLSLIASHAEVLTPLFQHGGLDTVLHLLSVKEMYGDSFYLCDLLQLVSQLTTHRKVSSVFTSQCGLKMLLSLPRNRFIASSLAAALYGLASIPSVMEQICLMPTPILSRLASWGVWLMDSPQSDSCHKHTAIFLSIALCYKLFQEQFEKASDGLKCLLDIIIKHTSADRQDDGIVQLRSGNRAVFNVLVALREYLRSHFTNKIFQIKRAVDDPNSNTQPSPGYKMIETEESLINDNIRYLHNRAPLSCWLLNGDFIPPLHSVFTPEIYTALISIVDKITSRGRRGFGNISMDTAMTALQILQIGTLTIQGQEQFLKIKIEQKTGMAVIIDSIRFSENEPSVINASMHVLYNFVGRPFIKNVPTSTPTTTTTEPTPLVTPERLRHVPVTSQAVTTPVLQNRRLSISNPQYKRSVDPDSDDTFRRSCKLIRSAMGVTTLIGLLDKMVPEAYLVRSNACRLLTKLARDPTILQILNKKVSRTLPELIRHSEPGLGSNTSGSNAITGNHFNIFREEALTLIAFITGRDTSTIANVDDTTLTKLEKAARVAQTPIRYSNTEVLQLIHAHLRDTCGLTQTAELLLKEANITPLVTQVPSSNGHAPLIKSQSTRLHASEEKEKEKETFTLESILTQFLYSQHLECEYPISVLPEFSLLYKHVCPRPMHTSFKEEAPVNITKRIFSREHIYGGGRGATRLTRRFKYGRFRPLKTFRDHSDRDYEYTCITFAGDNRLFAGTASGEIAELNMEKSEIVNTWDACHHGLQQFHTSPKSQLVLSYTFFENETKLWDVNGGGFVEKHTLPVVTSAQFANCTSSMICGTLMPGHIVIINTETGEKLVTLKDPYADGSDERTHKISIATFSPDDTLVMCDGVLWDYRSSRQVHRFDKFSNYGAEKFNKNGFEVIINSEIWDLRTFKLIRTCPTLDQKDITMNGPGDVLFGVPHMFGKHDNIFGKTFCTIDATDYDQITSVTLDHNRYAIALAINADDTTIALVENSFSHTIMQNESIVRLYEIGGTRTEFEQEDDSEEIEEEESLSFDSNEAMFSPYDDDDDDNDEDDEDLNDDEEGDDNEVV